MCSRPTGSADRDQVALALVWSEALVGPIEWKEENWE